jgi:hypothetical protein
MKQYTIKGFADLLVSSTQYKGLITKEKRLLLLDRCNWFISDIVRQNIFQDKPYETFVNISSQSLKRYLETGITKTYSPA